MKKINRSKPSSRRRPGARKSVKFLWVSDPWDTLDLEWDTTLRLAREASHQGHSSYWCDVRSIRLIDGKVLLTAAPIDDLEHPSEFSPLDFQQVHYRPDPPVDAAYIHPLQVLRFAVGKSKTTQVINPPGVLLTTNEKLEGAAFGKLFPSSLIASRWSILKSFGVAHERTVLKPLDSAQSRGVELLQWDTEQDLKRSQLEVSKATREFTAPVLLQEFLPGIHDGEVRLWFVDGKLLAYARKLPLTGDFRVNIDRGSRVVPTELERAEKNAAQVISKLLIQRRIRLAAVDMIHAKVTDFNFTSPGLINKMELALNTNLAREIIARLARTVYF